MGEAERLVGLPSMISKKYNNKPIIIVIIVTIISIIINLLEMR